MRRPRAGDERSSRTRAPPGLRPGALRPPARSSLTAGANARQKARPGAVWTLRWRAERRHTFARRCDLRPNDAPLGAPSPHFLRGEEMDFGVPGAAKNMGVPGLSERTVGTHYFDWHHTEADTLDKVNPEDFR